jgi:hypothetical protein
MNVDEQRMLGPLLDTQNAENVDPQQTFEEAAVEEVPKKFVLPTIPENYGPRTITLATLIDFVIQHSYHEFSILSELLQKKPESERKISVAHFARSTRSMFLKLYASVKWIKSSKRIDKLNSINFFLDQQAGYFIESADIFTRFAREELPFAG